MRNKRGKKRTVNYELVVEYADAHPRARQLDIAEHFHISQSQVCQILREAGRTHRLHGGGMPLKKKPEWSDEQFEWEQLLVDHHLGEDRGLRINSKRIFYGEDPRKERGNPILNR